MAVILVLNGVSNPHDHKKTRNVISIIKMKKSSNERVGGPPRVHISDGFRGFTTPGSKSLALVDNNPSSCGSSWRQCVGPRLLLGKVGSNISV